MILETAPLYAFAATVGFAVLFRVPASLLLVVGAGGGIAWWVYLEAHALAGSVIFATLVAATWVGGYGEVMARLTRRPATIFSTCAIIPLVPGRGIFETMVGAVRGDPMAALAQGLWTLGVAGAIASGLALITAIMPRSRVTLNHPERTPSGTSSPPAGKRPPAAGIVLLLGLLLGTCSGGIAEASGEVASVGKAVEGARLWLWPVPDGAADGTLAASAESGQCLLAGRLTADGAVRGRWRTILEPRAVGAQFLSDHAHVFGHGAHWLSVSASNGAWLVRLDTALNRTGLWPVAQGGALPTNDHFLVAEPGGVAVGIFLPGTGHRVYRIAEDGTLRGTVDVGGGRLRHANGASVVATRDGWLLLAPETLNPQGVSAILAIALNADWTRGRLLWRINDQGRNLAMPTAIRLDDRRLLVQARSRAAGHNLSRSRFPGHRAPQPGQPRPEASQPDLNPVRSDDGSLLRWVIDAGSGRVLETTEITEGPANRPHAALQGDRLWTAWDDPVSCRLLVERLRSVLNP